MSETKETPTVKFTKTTLADAIFLLSESLVVEIKVGGWSKFENGKAEIGVSFGDIKEARIRKKNEKAKAPLSEAEIDNYVKARRDEVIKAYKEEILTKLKECGVDKASIEAVAKTISKADLAFLLH